MTMNSAAIVMTTLVEKIDELELDRAHLWEQLNLIELDRDHYRTIAAQAARALKRTKIIGIYAEFHSLADAIDQLGSYTKEIEARCDTLQAQLEAAEGLAQELIDFEDNEALPSAALAAWHGCGRRDVAMTDKPRSRWHRYGWMPGIGISCAGLVLALFGHGIGMQLLGIAIELVALLVFWAWLYGPTR